MSKLTRVTVPWILFASLLACSGQPDSGTDRSAEPAASAELVMKLPMSTSSDEARSRFLAGLEASDMGRVDDARAAFDESIEADPEFAQAHLMRAFNANSLEDFVQHLEHASAKAAGASEAEQLMIESVQKGFDNDLEGQLALTQQLVDANPDSPRAWMFHSFAQAALGDHEAARETALRVTEMSPAFLPAYAALGNSYLFNEPKDFLMAEAYMQKVVELAPDEQGSHDLLGDVYRAQGKLIEAADAYTRAAELDPGNGSPLQQRGHVNSFLGNYDQARADYDAAMELSDPQVAANFATWRALVSVYEGNPEAAIAEFEGMLPKIDEMSLAAPLSAKISCIDNAGLIAMHHGMFDKAAEAIEQSRAWRAERADQVGRDDYRRNQEATVVYYEGMLAARQGNLDTAMAKAEEFMRLVAPNTDPEKNEPAHEVMGLAHLMAGDYQQAVDHYLQADPDDIYARYHLGLAYEGTGETDKASAIFEEVANHNFNFTGYALVRQEAIGKAG